MKRRPPISRDTSILPNFTRLFYPESGNLSGFGTTVIEFFDGSPRDFWAIDLGECGVQAARLEKSLSYYRLKDYFYQPYDLVLQAAIPDCREAAVKYALQQLLRRAGLVLADVVTSISGRSVFSKFRTIPPVPEPKLAQIARYEMQQLIPFQLSDITLDYDVLNQTSQGSSDVMILAIRKDVAFRAISCLVEAGCKVHSLNVNGIAAANWLISNGAFDVFGDYTAMLDIGTSSTQVVVRNNQQLVRVGCLGWGGINITSAIKDKLGISLVEAEQCKVSGCYHDCQDEIEAAIGILANQFQSWLSWFNKETNGVVDHIILTGGGSTLPGLVDILKEKLAGKVNVKLADVLDNVCAGIYNGDPLRGDKMAVVLGLALNCQQDVGAEINLLPWD